MGSSASLDKPLVAISSCLLGQAVRWDGRHKWHGAVNELFAPHVEWVAVCPEVEIGLGVPRPPIQIEQHAGRRRLVAPSTGEDHTPAMERLAAERLGELERRGLCGYVLKARSPSCGLRDVPVFEGARQVEAGAGLFAARLRAAWPALPVVEEGELEAGPSRQAFVRHVFTTHRWRHAAREGMTAERLRAFHRRHAALILAHDREAPRALDALLDDGDPDAERYRQRLAAALRQPATPRGHAEALERLAGSVRGLGRTERLELARVLREVRQGERRVDVALDLLRHAVEARGRDELAEDAYLYPDRGELALV